MVKHSTSEKTSGFFFFHSLWDFSVFTGKVFHMPLLIYNGLLILLLALFNTFLNNQGAQFSMAEAFLYSFFGIPVLAFFIYGMFYVVLNAFVEKRKAFFESFLVFVAISIPFLILGHVLDWLRSFFFGSVDLLLTGLIFMLLVYFAVNIVMHWRVYYKTSAFKIITSFFLVDMFFLFLAIVQYLSYLLSSLR